MCTETEKENNRADAPCEFQNQERGGNSNLSSTILLIDEDEENESEDMSSEKAAQPSNTNGIGQLFNLLKNHTHTFQWNNQKDCPCINEFIKGKTIPNADYNEIVNKLYGENSNCAKRYCCIINLLIAVFAVIALIVLLFLPSKCSSQDTLTHIKYNSTNIPTVIHRGDNSSSIVFARKIAINSSSDSTSKDTAANATSCETTAHGEIVYQNTMWHVYLYRIIIAILLLVTVILTIKHLVPYCIRMAELQQKQIEQKQRDAIRLYDEDREYGRLTYKTELGLYEKREKARIDEWVRNNDNVRKLDILEQERIADLSNVLLELSKIKNIVTISDPKGINKTIVIERSILSDDCCAQLQKILGKYITQDDCCCKLLKEVFSCLTDAPTDKDKCQKIKELIQCLFCHDGDCNKKFKELCDKIDAIAAILNNVNISMNPNGLPVVNNINFTKGK